MAGFKYIHKLEGKRVLIFGGSSGFGFAVAEAAIEHGAQVIISGSNQDKLDRAVSRLAEQYPDTKPGQVASAAINLADLESLDSRLHSLLGQVTSGGTKKIHHIVFTADATGAVPYLDKVTPEDVEQVLRLRVFSASILAKVIAGTEYLGRSADTSVTFTNGVNGHKPVKGWSLPGMASTALEGLVRGLAVDLAPIRVNLVSAGPVATELLASLPQSYLDMYAEQTVLKCLGRPEDIAEAYIYIMKDRYITGSIVASDGGRRIS
ncbi:hypothetical protein ACJ41O_010292 [Fusarium nematophilum]